MARRRLKQNLERGGEDVILGSISDDVTLVDDAEEETRLKIERGKKMERKNASPHRQIRRTGTDRDP